MDNHKPKSQAELLKAKAKANRSKNQFITLRMWISYFNAKLFGDRTIIPSNIGNNIFIGNNRIITKNYITALIYVEEFSLSTPIGFQSKLLQEIKKDLKNCTIDFTLKSRPYSPKLNEGGIAGRVKQWERVVNAPKLTEQAKERSTRLLYTYDKLKEQVKCYQSNFYIILRSDNGKDLTETIRLVRSYLFQKGIKHKEIKDDIGQHVKYISMMSDYLPQGFDWNKSIFSTRTLAEILPTLQGYNDHKGLMLGFDKINNHPYLVDVFGTARAKNFLTLGPSGSGKTFLGLTWCQDAHAKKCNLLTRDLKGNEFNSLTEAYGGISLSLAESDLKYLNTFDFSDLADKKDVVKFRGRMALSRELLKILVDAPPELAARIFSLIDSFLENTYRLRGVLEENPNTWTRTAGMNPYEMYSYFENFAGSEMRQRYSKELDYMQTRMRSYMYTRGSNSHIFREEVRIEDVLDTNCLTFNFGMLDAQRSYDETIFKTKFFFSDYIADAYIERKKSKGEWTFITNEEAQLAKKYTIATYKKDASMRRSQNVITNMLCNSVVSIKDNPDFATILSNTNLYAIGNVSEADRAYLIKQFSLEKYEDILTRIVEDPELSRTFLFVNKLEQYSTTALLEAKIPSDVARRSFYTPVDVVYSEGSENS